MIPRPAATTEVKRRDDQSVRPTEFDKIAACQTICVETARVSREHFGNSLQALVLTGSLTRDEATFVEEGKFHRLLGDAEFLLIFHEPTPLPSKVALRFLSQNIQESIAQHGIVGEVHLSAAHADYLSKLRPHIFAYELRNRGQVILRDPRILARIPNFPASDIPLEDGWRLLCNRMIEQLEALKELEQWPTILPSRLFYLTVKLYLDMATSLLLFAGEYGPSYSVRLERLRILADRHPGDRKYPFDLRSFYEKVGECTRWKLSAPNSHDFWFRLERGSGFSWWEEAVTYARLLWRWELAQLTRTKGEASNEELLEKWVRSQPTSRRLRGWLYVLRNQGWVRSWRNWPHWLRLAARASPRNWVYAEGSEVFFRLPSLLKADGGSPADNPDWEAMRRNLPVPDCNEQGLGGQRKRDWQQVASAVAWNYREFLENTRS